MAELTLPHQGFDRVQVHDEHKDNLLERHSAIIERVAGLGRNFFLYLHYSNIHTEIVKNVIRKYKDFDEAYFKNPEENLKRYEQYVQRACDYLEGVINAVEKNRLWGNTLFVILSDHGCGVGERPGEKAYGVYTYDYSIKVFCFFILKNVLPEDREIRAQVRSVDIMPTVLDITGLEPDENYKRIAGESLMGIIEGRETADRLAFCETGGLEGPNPSPYGPNVKCIRSKKWKLIFNSATNKKELYDLENDPREESNCVDKYPDIASKMWDKLIENTRQA
ncbi:MAG: sulfatase-like hydrolase/transferase [Candidatus Omnitrophica bacterium]|nr:sulfatase-like hydrolase/transferase [Candidatus Omnitrophota bacterium]